MENPDDLSDSGEKLGFIETGGREEHMRQKNRKDAVSPGGSGVEGLDKKRHKGHEAGR